MSGAQELPAEARRSIDVHTPEGIPVRFQVARIGDRAGAYLIDMALISAVMLGTVLVLTSLMTQVGGPGFFAVIILLMFALRFLYFPFFETRYRGRTPGKRALKLRVIDAHGGELTPEAIVVRNLMREIEFVFPLAALVAGRFAFPEAPGWLVFLALLWLFVFASVPFLDRHGRRIGDLVAGTLVIAEPRPLLLADLTGWARATARMHPFTPAQLDVYGIYELGVLEDLLRRPGPGRARTLAAVADRICRRIRWDPSLPFQGPEAFLWDFYAAQRERLERALLFGERRERKRTAAKRAASGD